MPPPGQLKNNFYHAALNASKAISAHGSLSILIGSAALNAHGMASRFAKDLDINVSRFDERLHKMFQEHAINLIIDRKRPQRFKGFASVPDPQRDARVKIDFSVRPDIGSLLRYTTKLGGITVANIHLLLVQKLIASTERQLPDKSHKVSNDLGDVLFCLETLARQQDPRVPDDETLRYGLTTDMWRRFWNRLGDRQFP